ncbi:MAG: nuclear transport factor 2 family protein [Solirubrobacteraceae bacterium]
MSAARGAATSADAQADEAAIRAALNAWPRAWARRDAPAICGLFAPDVVLSFPGGPDRTYRQACAQFRALTANRRRTVRYRRPTIERIVVDGDLAAVRLIWTYRIERRDGKLLERGREKGLDVFERQPDGAWRITVSHAFPLR